MMMGESSQKHLVRQISIINRFLEIYTHVTLKKMHIYLVLPVLFDNNSTSWPVGDVCKKCLHFPYVPSKPLFHHNNERNKCSHFPKFTLFKKNTKAHLKWVVTCWEVTKYKQMFSFCELTFLFVCFWAWCYLEDCILLLDMD